MDALSRHDWTTDEILALLEAPLLDLVHRAPLAALSGREARERGQGPDERIGRIQTLEGWQQTVEGSRLRRLGSGPARQPQAVPEPARQGEDLEAPALAEFIELEAHRFFQRAEIELDFRAAEQIVRPVPAARDQFERNLVLEDEGVRRQSEARLFLGQGVEAAHTFGREGAEEPVAEGIDDEGVAVAPPRRGQELGRVAKQANPRADAGQATDSRRHRLDGRQKMGGFRSRHEANVAPGPSPCSRVGSTSWFAP